jgi:hypothetical protein
MAIGLALMTLPLMVKEIQRSNQAVILMMMTLIGTLIMNKYLYDYVLTIPVLADSQLIALIPSAIAPMLITILIRRNAGLFVAFLFSLLNTFFFGASFEVFLSSLLCGYSAVYFSHQIRKRTDILFSCFIVSAIGLSCSLLLKGLVGTNTENILTLISYAIGFGLFNSFVVTSLLPIFEWMFERTTNISLLELSDLNHPLLREMSMEAAGTYQHSMMVGNLAEAAAEAIGANPLLARVMAYYHDIGKLTKSEYFIENYNRLEFDPHVYLTPSMSALVIISHVKDGTDLAQKHNLPQPIVDAIQQHHGTSLVYFFYMRAKKLLKEDPNSKPDAEADEQSFRYPGPIPQTKEIAIISLADIIESSSRTLKKPTPQSIEKHIHEIVDKKVQEGHLNDSQLTFNDLKKIKDRFAIVLKTMLHARIEYPKDEDNQTHHDDKEFTLKSENE